MSQAVASHPGTLTLLSRLSKSVYRKTPERLLGMTQRHFLVLSYLAEVDQVPQQHLQELLCIDANNLVILLNELETVGYAQRLRDPEDRRRHIVVLTDPGRVAYKKAEKAREAVEDEVLQALDPEERETLRRLLVKALEA
jgi:DNA-binding MarR family transcriptional regulator